MLKKKEYVKILRDKHSDSPEHALTDPRTNQPSRALTPLEELLKTLRFLALMELRVAFIGASLLTRTGVSEGSPKGLAPLELLARPVERQITNNQAVVVSFGR